MIEGSKVREDYSIFGQGWVPSWVFLIARVYYHRDVFECIQIRWLKFPELVLLVTLSTNEFLPLDLGKQRDP